MVAQRLREVFTFWRNGLVPLLMVALPFSLISFAIQIGIEPPLIMDDDTIQVNWAVMSLIGLLYPIASGALIVQMAALSQHQVASFSQCLSHSLRYAALLLLAYVMLGSAVYLGLVVFVLPGIWFYARLSQAPILVLLEQKNAMEAIKESFRRTEHRQWEIFTAIMMVGALILLITLLSANLTHAALGDGGAGELIHLLITVPVGIWLDILIFRYYSLETPEAN